MVETPEKENRSDVSTQNEDSKKEEKSTALSPLVIIVVVIAVIVLSFVARLVWFIIAGPQNF
ncbi:MAG: hypothetical protein ABR884_02305 [Minisyncoccia bacterium]|jgi:flagellar basal body-associated protein FliL